MPSRTKASKKRKSKQQSNGFYFWGLVTIAIVVLLVQITSNISHTANALGGLDIPISATTDGDMWWKGEYAYRRKLDTADLATATLAYEFDHKQLVKEGKSLDDGDDLKLVAQAENAFDEVATELSGMNSAAAKLLFDTSKYPKADYYLYYGNPQPQPSKVLGTFKLTERNASPVTGQPEEKPLLSISPQKQWNIKRKAGAQVTLDYEFDGHQGEGSSLYYILDGEAKLHSTDLTLGAKQGTVTLTLDNSIVSGSHDIFFVLDTEDEMFRSNTAPFIVSAPVFVALTVDWEGRGGEQDWVLQALADLSAKYQMPLTHFFNPRIYVSNQIPSYHTSFITTWVKNRHDLYQDEIALHLHMFYDMVEAAGVTAIRSPRWGSGYDGYDVLASGYSYEDMSKIIKWALDTFKRNGLPEPKGFRTGGWFADLDILKAVNDAGFVYDSSGRDAYTFGNLEQKGHWKLTANTQPYHPSNTDQNQTSVDDSMKLLEMPNNGADSYWHTGEQLEQRFYANYSPGKVLDQPKMVTYLVHPDWFSTDQPRLEALFAEIDKYSLNNDSGPVVYTTMSETLEEWN